MTGFGSPCGACKFLRRKCIKGCVFAPYFCHEQGTTHFAAIHKVFGASNVSKLLAHLPVSDRLEAAVTISYEAQARLQDPIYGCVSHIFALRQQVVNLQAQLASLKAQAAQNLANGSMSSCPPQDKFYDRLPSFQQECNGFFHLESLVPGQASFSGNPESIESMLCYGNGFIDPNSAGEYHHSSMTEERSSYEGSGSSLYPMATLDMQMDSRKWDFQDMEDLQSVAFAYLHHS